jgi:hypothetical protein
MCVLQQVLSLRNVEHHNSNALLEHKASLTPARMRQEHSISVGQSLFYQEQNITVDGPYVSNIPQYGEKRKTSDAPQLNRNHLPRIKKRKVPKRDTLLVSKRKSSILSKVEGSKDVLSQSHVGRADPDPKTIGACET